MSAVVQPDSGELTVLMSKDEALATTAKIKSYMGVLCQLVKEAHDKQAWRALGYGSWAAYCKAEFDYSRSYSYRLIGHVNRILELSAAAGIEAEVSPMGDTLTERATRDLDMDDAVAAVTDATADLPDEATDEERSNAATEGIAKMRARKEAEAQAEPAPEPRPCSDENCGVMVTADHGMCPFHRGKALADEACAEQDDSEADEADAEVDPEGNPPAPSAQDPVQNDAATSPADVDAGPKDDGGEADPATAPPVVKIAPSLPSDWRNRIANACYLTRCPAEVAAAHASPDDIADLSALTDWCFQFVQAIKENDE